MSPHCCSAVHPQHGFSSEINRKYLLTHFWQMEFPIFIIWMSPLLRFRAFEVFFYFFISLFNEYYFSKHDSPRWDPSSCSVTSGAILFAYVQRTPCLYGLIILEYSQYLSQCCMIIDVVRYKTRQKYLRIEITIWRLYRVMKNISLV